jgi:hypothetical protein
MIPNVPDWEKVPEGATATCIKELLRADYLEFAKEQRTYRPADAVAFGMRLGKLVRLSNTQVKPPDDVYGIKVDSLGRASAYRVPGLAECRRLFEEKMGASLNWMEHA